VPLAGNYELYDPYAVLRKYKPIAILAHGLHERDGIVQLGGVHPDFAR
jgi:hypothetical protein